MLNLDDFRDEHEEAISQAIEFRRRARKGLPYDRWASERQAHLVAKGIGAMLMLIAFQAATLEALADASRPD